MRASGCARRRPLDRPRRCGRESGPRKLPKNWRFSTFDGLVTWHDFMLNNTLVRHSVRYNRGVTTKTTRTIGKTESVLLQTLAKEQRTTLSTRQDRELLASLTSAPANLLSRMADKGVLIPLGGGRYVVSSWAGDSLAHAAPFNVL